MLSDEQKAALCIAADAARKCEGATGCPAALTVAQWALESGWGKRQPGCNCFGLKAYHGCPAVQLIDTWEVINGKRVNLKLPFAAFPDLESCFVKHAELITSGRPYKPFWSLYLRDHSLRSLIIRVAKVYATDPAYAAKLFSILNLPEVKAALPGLSV